MHTPLAVRLLAAAPLALPAFADGFPTAEQVARAASEAGPAVAKALGIESPAQVTVRIATRSELEEALFDETLHQFRVLFPDASDADAADAQRRTFAEGLSTAVLGKYAVRERAILIVPENFALLAELTEIPEIESAETLVAILVHEFVHAADESHYGWSETLGEVASTDAIFAFNAVLEGHAQWVARRVCAEEGWSAGFETFARAIGASPEVDDEVLSQLLRIAAITFTFAYEDGERFIAHVFEHGGQDAVDRAFRAPPGDTEVIFHPDWFLHPENRPRLSYDLAAALDVFQKAPEFPTEEWVGISQPLLRPQLETALELLPEDDVRRLLDNLMASRMTLMQFKANPNEKLAVAVAYEMSSAAEAVHLLAAQERLMRVKDEKMKGGFISIKEAHYTPVKRGEFDGVHARKKIEVAGQEIAVEAIVLTRGRLVVEITLSGTDFDEAFGLEVAEAILERGFVIEEDEGDE